jgi:hypothetical protein
MPRVSQAGDVRFHIPGVYAALLRRECVTGSHARLGPLDAEYARKSPAEREAAFEERLTAGEPLEVPNWYITGHTVGMPASAPDWLRLPSVTGGAHMVRVHSDDTVEPISFLRTCDAAG